MKRPKRIPFAPRGLNKDKPPAEVSPEEYTSGRNMVWRDGAAARTLGHQVMVAASGLTAGEFIMPVRTPGAFYWLVAGDGAPPAVAVHDGATSSIITPAGIWDSATPAPEQWSGGSLNGLPFVNPQEAEPAWWDGQLPNLLVALPDWPAGATCGVMRAFKNHLFAINMTEAAGDAPHKLRWSDAADPGTVPQSWSPAPDNEAGDVELATTYGNLMDALQLRDELVIYKQHATHLCRYVGGNEVFAFRPLFHTSGLLAQDAVAEVGGRHVVLTDGDLVVHDGVNLQSLVDQRMRSWLFGAISTAEVGKCHMVWYPREDELWLAFPEEGATMCTLALVWNQRDNALGIRELAPATNRVARGSEVVSTDPPLTWDLDPDTWEQDLTQWRDSGRNLHRESMVQVDGARLLRLDGDTRRDGANIPGALEKTSADLGDPAAVKFVTRIWPKLHGVDGETIMVRLGRQMQQTDPVEWGTEVPFVIGRDNSIPTMTAGRYISVGFRSQGEWPWRLESYELELGGAARY